MRGGILFLIIIGIVGLGMSGLSQVALSDPVTLFPTFIDSFSVAAQDIQPMDVAFSSDGTKMFVVGTFGDNVYEYALSSAFDVSTASFVDSFSVAAQENDPRSFAFSSDGTKMFVVGAGGDDVNEYALSSAYDVSTASFVDSFSVAAQETAPTGLSFSSDGTKMFVTGLDGLDVNEYALSTAYDVSTASFVDSFSVAAQDSFLTGVAFSSDGTKMFVVGDSEDNVNEYTLSTAFDVSTASFVNSFSVAGQEINLQDLAFSSDGTKMFVVGSFGDDVNEYTLSTAFTLFPTFVDSFSVAAQETVPQGIAFSSDGTKMFVVGSDGDDVNEYTLSTAFTLFPTFVDSFSVAAQDSFPTGLAFSSDGVKMFVVGESGEDVNEYTLSTAFDVSTASFVDSFSVGGQEDDPYGLAFSSDGTKMFVVGGGEQAVNEYTLSTAYDVSTASFVDSFSVAAQDAIPIGVAFSSDGTKMFVTGFEGADVNEYTLSTAYDVSTASFVDSFSVAAQATVPFSVAFSSDGAKMFVVSNVGDGVYEYTLFSAYDVSTASFVGSFSVGDQEDNPYGLAFSSDGTKMFVVGAGGDAVNEYTLSTGFTLFPTFVDSFSVAAQETTPTGLAFSSDGTKMFISGFDGADVNEYTLSTAFDISTASFVDSFSVAAQAPRPQDVAFSSDGTKMFVVDNNGANNIDEIDEYTLFSPFDISTASFVDSFSVTAQQLTPQGLAFSSDGTKMFVVGSNGHDATEYTLSNAFDVSTAFFVSSFSFAAQAAVPTGLAFSSDGAKMFVVGAGEDKVNEYQTSIMLCIPPPSGVWIITENCEISSEIIAPASIMIQNNSIVTINSGGILIILSGENIIIIDGSGLELLQGSTLQINS